MGKSAKTTPPTDPVAAANAQTASAIATANYDAKLNRYNQNTPNGTVTWSNSGTDANPQWTQSTNLSPQEQFLQGLKYQGQFGSQDIGNQLLANSGGMLSGPVNTNGLPQVTSQVNAGNLDQARQQAQNAVYQQQTSMLDPQYQQQQEQLNSQLANQGITQGSEAWNNAQNNFARQKDFAYSQARNSAVTAGNDLANQQFGQGLSAAQLQNSASGQALNQLFSLRGNTLNEISALMNGSQVSAPDANPSQGINAANTDVASNFYSSQQQQQANANAKNAAANANTQAGASIASAALMALMMA